MKKNKKGGFTLIEILVVIGIIAVLATIVIIAINPARQFAQSRNTQRTSNVNTILNAIGQRMADNRGVFEGTFTIDGTDYTCDALPTTAENISNSDFDLSCLTPTYIPASLPVDPQGGEWVDEGDYDTLYEVVAGPAGRVTVCAPLAAGEDALADPEAICVER